MTHAPNAAWRAEFVAARAFLTPRINGLRDLISMRSDTRTEAALKAWQDALEDLTRRAGKLDDAIASLDNAEAQIDDLYDDGYPTVPMFDVPPSVFQELVGQRSDLDLALEQFETDTSAQSIVTGPVTTESKT